MNYIVNTLGGNDHGDKWLNTITLPLWPDAERFCGDFAPCS